MLFILSDFGTHFYFLKNLIEVEADFYPKPKNYFFGFIKKYIIFAV